MSIARLLLVEDNPDNREVLAVLLGQTYEVAAYGSAAEAVAALETFEPDVLVLDIGMEPVDGVQCLATIRAHPRHAGTPAVALTAFARDVERKEFLRAGFQAVVTKPVLEHHQLVAVIDRLLVPRRLTDENRDGMLVDREYRRRVAS